MNKTTATQKMTIQEYIDKQLADRGLDTSSSSFRLVAKPLGTASGYPVCDACDGPISIPGTTTCEFC